MLVFSGLGAAAAKPQDLDAEEWQEISEIHIRMTAIATDAVDLEASFFGLQEADQEMADIDFSKVTIEKCRASVLTWLPKGYECGTLLSSIGIVLSQKTLPDDLDQFDYYRSTILKHFPKKAARDLLLEFAQILRCYSLFSESEDSISMSTLPNILLDAGAENFEMAAGELGDDEVDK